MPAPVRLSVRLTDRPSVTVGGTRSTVVAAASAFGFFALMPYPAVPIGGSTGLQAGHLFALVALVALVLAPRFQAWMTYWPLLVMPLVLSLARIGFGGDGDFEIGAKSSISMIASMAALVAAQLLAIRAPLALLTGMASAAVLHALVGMLQIYGFANGEFPLLSLYVNPSFLNIEEQADTIVRWIQRPFGLFPEPSAMAASLAPWVVLWIAILSGQSAMRQAPTRIQRWLFRIAATGSLLLIILSRSGHILFTITAILFLVPGWLKRSKVGLTRYALTLLLFTVLIPVLVWFAGSSLGARLTRTGTLENDSWSMRWASIQYGMQLLFDGDAWTLLFGVGSGQLSTLMAKATGFRAVWSILLTYAIETGVIGMIAILIIGWQLFREWQRSRDQVIFVLVLFVWLTGVTFTTSYNALLSIWLTLGWLSRWREVSDAK